MGKTKTKSRGGTWFMRFQIRKKNTTKGVVVVKCCFKEKVQYYYVCSAHSKCNSTAQPVFTWIHLCTKFLNPSNSFVVCTSETTSRPINPFFSSVQCTFKSSWCLQVLKYKIGQITIVSRQWMIFYKAKTVLHLCLWCSRILVFTYSVFTVFASSRS